jgi:tetratricopeptide (TPR) repeat protein
VHGIIVINGNRAMKLRLLVIAATLILFVQGVGFAGGEAEALNMMGNMYYKQGNYSKAIECFLEAKSIYEKTVGKEHPDYATLLNNLGALYYSMGDYGNAERYYLEATAIYENTLGKGHPDYATSLQNLGGL